MATVLTVASPTGADPTGTADLQLVYQADHADRARADLPSALRRPRLLALAGAVGEVCQVVEDLAFQVYADTPLQSAGGALLDRWSGLVGEARGGLGDAEYRRAISARIAADRCAGTVDALLGVWALLVRDDDGDELRLFECHAAGVVLQVLRRSPLSTRGRRRAARIMARAKPVGIGVGLVEADAAPFQFGARGFGAGALGRAL